MRASSRRAACSPSPAGPADLLGDLGHLLAGLEETLGVAAVEVAQVERHQPPGRVEHVEHGGVGRVGVAHRVGEHGVEPPPAASAAIRAACTVLPGPDPATRCETTSTSRSAGSSTSRQRASTARARSSRRAVTARPSSEPGPSSSTVSRPAACSAIVSSVVTGTPRSPRRWVADTSRHTAAQPCLLPASTVTRGSPASRVAPPRTGVRRARTGAVARRQHPGRLDREVDAEHRADAGAHARLGEAHRPVDPVAVGQREGVHAVLGRPLDQPVRVGGAVAQRVAGGHVQVDEGITERHAAPLAGVGQQWHRGSERQVGEGRSRRLSVQMIEHVFDEIEPTPLTGNRHPGCRPGLAAGCCLLGRAGGSSGSSALPPGPGGRALPAGAAGRTSGSGAAGPTTQHRQHHRSGERGVDAGHHPPFSPAVVRV